MSFRYRQWTRAAALAFLLACCQAVGIRQAQADSMTWPPPETKQLVRTVQFLLRAHGCPAKVDGRFGMETRHDIVLFQRAHALRASGRMDGATWRALVVRVKMRDKGDAVRAVQELLNDNAEDDPQSPKVAVDGIYSRQTQRAVESFQSGFRLKRDGTVGPVTWSWLLQGATQAGFGD